MCIRNNIFVPPVTRVVFVDTAICTYVYLPWRQTMMMIDDDDDDADDDSDLMCK